MSISLRTTLFIVRRSGNCVRIFVRGIVLPNIVAGSTVPRQHATASYRFEGHAFLLPVYSQVFEALYRESHGLPPRIKPAASSRESTDECQGAETEAEEAATQREDTTPELAGADEGGLAADGEVARLLDELQKEFDVDCSDSGGEVDDGEEYRSAVGKENEPNQSDAGGTSRGSDKEGQPLRSDDDQVAGKSPRSRHRDRAKQHTEYLVLRTGGDAPADRPPLPPEEGDIEEELLLPHGQRGRVDISRMKIDGPKRRTGVGPRPRSAPSACLSAGGFSRLSRTSSLHLTRTASQKLLQATKEAQEKESSEGQELGEVLRRAPGSLVAQADSRIDVVQQKADGLQVSRAVGKAHWIVLNICSICAVTIYCRCQRSGEINLIASVYANSMKPRK